LAGVFVFAFAAQLCAAVVSWFGLRPDPLLTARNLPAATTDTSQEVDRRAPVPVSIGHQYSVIGIIAIAQAVMVALMAMAPLHIMHQGGTHEMVGLTLSLHIAG